MTGRRLSISTNKLELKVGKNQKKRGSFSLSSIDEKLCNGKIYSSDIRMNILNPSFEDVEIQVEYEFSSIGLEEGDVIKGDVYIVSNAGEYYLPFVVMICSNMFQTTDGTIRNLFHFANLAQGDWDGALKYFYSEDFPKILDGNDKNYLNKYYGLSKYTSSQQNMDQFLSAVKKKQPILYMSNQTTYELESVEGIVGDEIHIQKQGWGYVHLDVIPNGIVTLEKEVLEDDDFLGNECRLDFYVDEKNLHAGKNFGTILLRSAQQELMITIIAQKKKSAAQNGMKFRHERKYLQWRLMKMYVDFRCKKLSVAAWTHESEKIVERMSTINEGAVENKLYKAQILLIEERYQEAKWILEHVETENQIKQCDREIYAYYLYLCTLYHREDDYVNQIAHEVGELYKEQKTSFKILWTLLYLDEDLELNPEKKLALVERQYEGGCTSPIMYIEAYRYFVEKPSLLAKLSGFETQIMLWAVRNKMMDKEVLKQFIYLVGRQKLFSPTLLQIMTEAYKLVPSDELIGAICTHLIKGNCLDVKYFKWYEKGIAAQLRITRLYEYFILSIPLSYQDILPKSVLMYFSYNVELEYSRMAFLYANILRHENEMPEMVRSYERLMQKFVKSQIKAEHINRDLSYLYSRIFTIDDITTELAPHLAKLMFINEVRLPSNNMKKVIVLHEQLTEEYEYPVIDGTIAYPQIYSREYELFMEDEYENRFCIPEEYATPLFEERESFEGVIKTYVSSNIGFCLAVSEGKKHYLVIDQRNAECCRVLVDSSIVRESFKRELRIALIQYYYENEAYELLDDLLVSCDYEKLDAKDRGELISYMIMRGMYDEGYQIIQKYGVEQIQPKTCVRLCNYHLTMTDFLPDDMLLSLCYQAFRHGKYDDHTLKYLVENFCGLTKEMRNIWKAASSFDIDSHILKERILIQMLYTGATVGEKNEIFTEYIKEGSNTSIEIAYLSFHAYEYFVNRRIVEDSIFDQLIKNYRMGENLNDACRLALLKHFSEQRDMERTDRTNLMLKRFIKEFIHKNMFFKFFMDYLDIVPELSMFADKTIIEYATSPDSKVILHYILEGQDDTITDVYKKEEMRNMYGGIFSKEFILFFGENLQYYITEAQNDREKLTESNTVSISDVVSDNEETRFDLLNDMVVAQTLQDEDTLLNLMEEYARKDFIVKEIFTIK